MTKRKFPRKYVVGPGSNFRYPDGFRYPMTEEEMDYISGNSNASLGVKSWLHKTLDAFARKNDTTMMAITEQALMELLTDEGVDVESLAKKYNGPPPRRD